MFRSRAFWTILLLLTLVNPSSASAACPWGELAGKAIRFFTRQTTPSENGVPKEWHQDRTPERRLQVELAKGKNLDNTSIPELFLAQAKRDPDRVLLIDESRGPLTNRDIVAGVYFLKDRIAGLGPEENLGMMLPASAGATVATLATQFAGKTPTMLNFTAGNKNISSAIQTAGVKKILTSRVFMEDLLKRSPDLKAYESMFVYLEDMREAPGAKLELAKAMLKSRLGAWHDLEKIKPAKYSVILFTSGSSGSPKAVPLTHANQIANIQSILQAVPLHEKDRIIGVLPPFHSFGATGNVVLPLITGAKMAFYPNPLSGKGVAEAVEKYEGTVVLGTPTFLQLMARGAKDGQLSTLRIGISGAERMTEKAAHAIAEKLPPGFVVLEAYGTTEAAPAVTMNRLDNPIAGSIGELLPGVEGILVIENESGGFTEVPPGQMGRLLIRGKNLFDGYFNYEGPSPFVEVNGKSWYDTGDIVSPIPGTRSLKMEGRANMDFEKIGGEMIPFQPIIDILNAKFEVTEANRFVVASDRRSDKPRLVLFTTQEGLDPKTVNDALTEAGLTNLSSINRIVTMKEFPLLGTGKLDKKALKDRAQQD